MTAAKIHSISPVLIKVLYHGTFYHGMTHIFDSHYYRIGIFDHSFIEMKIFRRNAGNIRVFLTKSLLPYRIYFDQPGTAPAQGIPSYTYPPIKEVFFMASFFRISSGIHSASKLSADRLILLGGSAVNRSFCPSIF